MSNFTRVHKHVSGVAKCCGVGSVAYRRKMVISEWVMPRLFGRSKKTYKDNGRCLRREKRVSNL